ncbi:MAG TPA: glycosyltransferase [Beutenbergiaceae bacterium]|nr:glycosyltransferase [Beutenbergiaceae bacterium]
MTVPRPNVCAVIVGTVDSPYLPETLAALAGQRLQPDRIVWALLPAEPNADAQAGQTRTVEAPLDARGQPLNPHGVLAAAGLTPSGEPDQRSRPDQRAQPEVQVVPLRGAMSFTAAVHSAVNQARVDTGWLWLLHDDSAPEPDALTHLLATVERSASVAIAGAKQVDWDEPDRLLSVGVSMTVDGQRYTGIESGEIDQGQHDGREDVYAVGTAGMLIRTDLWRSLRGADPVLGPFGDGADMCRRARLAGHRVVVAPGARVRHARAGYFGLRTRGGARTREPVAPDPRHSFTARRTAQLHSWLVRSPLLLMPLVALAALLLGPLRALWQVTTNELTLAGAELRAALTAVLRPRAVLRARRRARRTKKVPARRLVPLQARWGQLLRARRNRRLQAAAEQRAARAPSELEMAERAAVARRRRLAFGAVLVVSSAVAAVTMLPVVLSGPLIGGALLPVDATFFQLWQAALSGWVSSGDGYPGPTDPFLGVLGVLSAVTGGPLGTPVQVTVALVLLLAMPLAAITAWFAAGAATRSVLVRMWAAGVWAFGPPLLLGLGDGRLGSVLAHVALPLVGLGLARALGLDRRDVVISGMVGAKRVTQRPTAPRRGRAAKRARLAALAAVGRTNTPEREGRAETSAGPESEGAAREPKKPARESKKLVDGVPGHAADDTSGDVAEGAEDDGEQELAEDDGEQERAERGRVEGNDPSDGVTGEADTAGDRDRGDRDRDDRDRSDLDRDNRDRDDGQHAATDHAADDAADDGGKADVDGGDDAKTGTEPAAGSEGENSDGDDDLDGTGPEEPAADDVFAHLEPIRSNTADGPDVQAEPRERATVISRMSRAPSTAAAAAAGLAFAVAAAGAPVLLPAGLAGLVLIALVLGRSRNLPAGRARLVLVALPSVVLSGPVWLYAIGTWSDGGWRLLLADPGVPVNAETGPAWLALLGWPAAPQPGMDLPGAGLFASLDDQVLPLAATGALVVAALLALVRGGGRGRAARIGWLLSAIGLATALASNRTEVGIGRGPSGADELVTGWAGPGTSLVLLGFLLAVVSGLDGLRGALAGRSFGWRQISAAVVAVCLVTGLAITATVWPAAVLGERDAGSDPNGDESSGAPTIALRGRGPDPVPALGRTLQETQGTRVLALTTTPHGVDAQLWRGNGPQLTETSTAVTVRDALGVLYPEGADGVDGVGGADDAGDVDRADDASAAGATGADDSPGADVPPGVDSADAHLMALVAELVAGAVDEAAGRLAEHAVGVVVVPPADTTATGVAVTDEAARTRLIAQLDAVLGLERVTENPAGVIWRVNPGSTEDALARVQVRDGDGTVLGHVPMEHDAGSVALDGSGTGRTVVLAERSDAAWRADIGGRALRASTEGWQQQFLIPDGAAGELNVYYRPTLHTAAQVVTAVLLGLTVLLALPTRRRRVEGSRVEGDR